MFFAMLNAMEYSKSDYCECIKNKIQYCCQNKFLRYIHIISLNYQRVPQYVTHLSFSSHLLLLNTRGLCRLLRHRLPTSSQLFINCTGRKLDRDWSVVFGNTFARTWVSVHLLRTIQASRYPRVSTFNFMFIYTYFIDVF